MSQTGTQLREQMLNFLLQNYDAQEREIAELQKKIAELQKQVDSPKQNQG